jgi:hypothetical protein
MRDPYTELLEAWADIRAKPDSLPPELVDEMVEIATNIRQWISRGENDRFRQTLDELRAHIPKTAPPRRTAYEIAVTLLDALPFEVDDPETPSEPFAFRCWRTVECGYSVMDAKLATDPSFRVYPRIEYPPPSRHFLETKA